MADSVSFGNGTTFRNRTEDFDFFCVKLLVVPIIWAVFSVICACVGVPASVWLLWVLIQRQRNSTGSSNNVYMLNLTIMDFIFNVFKLPSVLNFFVWHDLTFPFFIIFLEGIHFICCPLFVASSCVDCYMAVVRPIMYVRISKSYRVVVCVVVWFLSLAFGLLFVFVHDLVLYPVSAVPFVLAIAAITFCDIVILRTLRKPDPSGRSDVHPQKQRAMQTITVSFVMTLVSYLPCSLVLMAMSVIPLSPQEIHCHVSIASSIFAMLGSTVQPLLYLMNLGSLNVLRVCDCI